VESAYQPPIAAALATVDMPVRGARTAPEYAYGKAEYFLDESPRQPGLDSYGLHESTMGLVGTGFSIGVTGFSPPGGDGTTDEYASALLRKLDQLEERLAVAS